MRRTGLLLAIALGAATLASAAATFAFGTLVLPDPPEVDDPAEGRLVNLIAFGVYMLATLPLGGWWMARRTRPARDWLRSDRAPTTEERRLALRAPRNIVYVNAVFWGLAAIVFGVLNATFSAELGGRVASTIAIAGLITCAVVYLVSERLLRPIAARALAGGAGGQRLGPGIKTRTFIVWAVGTGVPLLGLMMVATSTLTQGDFTRRDLAWTVLIVAAIGALAALLISMLSARAVSDPVVGLRRALKRVEDGDLGTEVQVYDGSEVGQLQAGFNRMVEGLRERERIQDLFGRHVGEDVARAALDQEVELGGELRDVAVLFTDVVGSTKLASGRPPHEVVELLNSFFAVVVEVVDQHGGSVNKFEGDAALAVFGAPVPLDDAPDRALAAARELAQRLPEVAGGLKAAIGVSAGEVVAGNVGEESRFEYTVIGDPVNEAARLTELAKEKPGRLLASESILERAHERESQRWRLDGRVTLRGRSEETRLAVPA